MIEVLKKAFDLFMIGFNYLWNYEVPFSNEQMMPIGEIIILGAIIGLLIGIVLGFTGIGKGSEKDE